MKQIITSLSSIVFVIAFTASVKGQTIFFSTTDKLCKIDISTCEVSVLSYISIFGIITDIAFHPNGRLYMTDGKKLYVADTLASGNNYGSLGDLDYSQDDLYMNALVADSDGKLYGASSDGHLYTVNIITAKATLIGALPGNSGGDMTFHNGKLYLAATNNRIYQVNISRPRQSILLGRLEITNGEEFYGFVKVGRSCDNSTAYGGQTSLYSVDLKTLQTTIVCNLGMRITGMTTTTDYTVSDCRIAATIVPNPNVGDFRLEVEDLPTGEWNMEIYSITGQLVQRETRNILQANGDVPISLRDVSGGLYLLRMVNDDGVVITRKFIVGR